MHRVLLPFLLALSTAVVAAPPPPAEVSNPNITAPEITAHVRYLASDELQGRGSGTPGNDRAADYIAERFRAVGLKPAGGKGTYFQQFPVLTQAKLGENNRLAFTTGAKTQAVKLADEYLPLSFSGNGSVTAPLVFAGYGISKPDLGHDDYKGLDVRGKVVVVLRHTPDLDENGKFGPFAVLHYKTMTAREKGAAGVLLVTGPLSDQPEDLGGIVAKPQAGPNGGPPKPGTTVRFSATDDAGIPVAFVRRQLVGNLLSPRGRTLRDLQIMIAHGETASFAVPGVKVSLRVDIDRRKSPTRNVIGYLEGSDPNLKDQVVVIGAHYDHLGMGDEHSLSGNAEPEIHHGADDNASGTAGVLELAQYFAANREKLGRSVAFMGFSGEEIGLLGSNYWTKNPTIPLDRIAAMVNLDMVGRMGNDTAYVMGVGSSANWPALVQEVGSSYGLTLKTGGLSGFSSSDQQSFYAVSIPVLFFFTGVHTDYHRPSDTWEKINAEGQTKLMKAVAGTLERISRMPQRPAFTRSQTEEPTPGGSFRVYLGTIPDYAERVEGVALQGVREGSPAEKAGLRAKDVIVEFDGKRIRNVQEYTTVLGAAKANAPVKIVVLRGGERLTLTATPLARRQ